MEKPGNGCLLCGASLVYREEAEEMACSLCGEVFPSNASCPNGHYVCDACHAEKASLHITRVALQTKETDPIAIASQMMAGADVHMHGPEHHYLVPAALLAAYYNAGGTAGGGTLAQALTKARQRASEAPGGICGLWGCCGAGVGVGIFVSVATGAGPLSTDSWRLANNATSQCLAAIAQHGGPRCCKRDSWLSITQAARFAKENMGVELPIRNAPVCGFYPQNKECLRAACPFYPKG